MAAAALNSALASARVEGSTRISEGGIEGPVPRLLAVGAAGFGSTGFVGRCLRDFLPISAIEEKNQRSICQLRLESSRAQGNGTNHRDD